MYSDNPPLSASMQPLLHAHASIFAGKQCVLLDYSILGAGHEL